MNPLLLSAWTTPYATVPFNDINIADFEPAIREAIKMHEAEIKQIIDNPNPPTFENTIEALEISGRLLERVSTIMENQLGAETCDELQQIAETTTPLLTEHYNNITFDKALFERVKSVYEKQSALLPVQAKLLQDTYDSFVRHGANLSATEQDSYRELSEKLSLQSLRYGQNILKETAAFSLHLTDEEETDGLPQTALYAAAEEAKRRGLEGWVFTLQAPSFMPFMKYAKRRELRQKLYEAYTARCTHNDEYNNTPIAAEIADLYRQMAQLQGYTTYADYVLEQRMAEKRENVYELLTKLLQAYRPAAEKEIAEIKALAQEKDALADDFAPWDTAYYANLLKERDYALDDEQLRPYFKLEYVIDGVFGLATRLYGITFRSRTDIAVYHPDVTVSEVLDADGSLLGILYLDFFPRESKRPGAWMTEYKGQWHEKECTAHQTKSVDSRPHVSLVMNFTKPTADTPSLLTLGEVETFLHEFGHALHGLFADSTYKSLSGTNVYWDFVELPSQFMENFLTEQEFLNTFARHYVTGKPLPEELIARIIKARNFGEATACLRQLNFGLLDMAWYTQTEQNPALHREEDMLRFEQQATADTRLLPLRGSEKPMSVQFSHIFAGGYSAGYYSYKWAEVLDADAFSLFQERGIFDKETAQSFRRNILGRGGEEHPLTLYTRFRGRKPTIDALLKRTGIRHETR